MKLLIVRVIFWSKLHPIESAIKCILESPPKIGLKCPVLTFYFLKESVHVIWPTLSVSSVIISFPESWRDEVIIIK